MPAGPSENIHRMSSDQGRIGAEEISRVLDRLSDPFLAFDKNLSLRYINKKAENLFQLYPDVLDETIYKAYHRCLSEQRTINLEAWLPGPDLWLEHHMHPSEDGLSVYIRDITEKK